MISTQLIAVQLFLANEGFIYDGYDSKEGQLIFVKEGKDLGMLINLGDGDNYYTIVKFPQNSNPNVECDNEFFENIQELLVGYDKFKELLNKSD